MKRNLHLLILITLFLFLAASASAFASDCLVGIWQGTQKLEKVYLERINTISPIEYKENDFTYATETIFFEIFQNESGKLGG